MRSLRTVLLIMLAAPIFLISEAHAQSGEGQQKAQEIAAIFSRTKHKVKEKRGVRIESHVDIKSEPVVKQNIAEYSGRYESGGDWFDLRVGANGKIEAEGSEPAPQKSRRFTLRDARIEGALLVATKVYEDGAIEKFEAAFLNRTIRIGQDGAATTAFGLGIRYDPPITNGSLSFTVNKLFYELK